MNKLLEFARNAQSIAILGHVRPDGDCVGACLAVWNYLAGQYPDKEIQVYLEQPPVKFHYLKRFDDISQDTDSGKQYDLCICLDSSDTERLGDFAGYLAGASQSICIDHHVTNRGYAMENIIDPDASATCELLCGFLDQDQIDQTVAECIYTGILHDTNVFKNSNTTAKTMEAAGRMMAKGIDFGRIIDESFYRKTYVQNQILGRALMESILFLHGKCIFSAVRMKDMDFYNVTSADLDGIVDQLRVTGGVECAIFLHEIENHVYKVSMRSNQYVDVSRVAAFFGGGGHVRAAGCTMNGSMYDVVNNLSKHIEKQIQEHEG
ncbi:MAG: bifunctional oligoribonuclease/PAP phosphatase NrnA [Lachnospiraceae bacterium]|nr:bifunctional oligoribonuclease/PAP phosphatase NrnA [Lachnospiraceae bacterium]